MSASVARDTTDLKRRLVEFLASDSRDKQPLRQFLRSMGDLGDAVIFGGMVRDICLGGARRFASDVDIVVDTPARVLQRHIAKLTADATLNAFGGVRIRVSTWPLDVWALESTWAVREKYVKVNTLHDLVNTTFFSWDAWTYDVSRQTAHSRPDVLEQMRRRVLDINLEPNPRPRSMALRTLRWLMLGNLHVTPRLASYVHEHLTSCSVHDLWEHEVASCRAAGKRPVLSRMGIERIRRELAEYLSQGSDEPFGLQHATLPLPIPPASPGPNLT